MKRSFDEKLGVLRPFRFPNVVVANGLPESFPQSLELKNRQPLVSFLLFCAGVHNVAKNRVKLIMHTHVYAVAVRPINILVLTSFGGKFCRRVRVFCRA
ncbi:hypothetical protein [Mesorhizobium humile]|uniref:Uncharacterized protein n=1 Tax=Mesorhizobium humile TaxID=3072313 RepID=A0ABU4YEA1_9HYPH|nr:MULTISPECIES: hypothetical protein [unclassified Mesorhizobium]MDX8460634.1 hypothetical protein [Mesorhizobium sp. VK2D]MDX8485277.1 hypothetical protein [Mesorhizobium sp. VK2B]